jgi:uncharacterized membrane protein
VDALRPPPEFADILDSLPPEKAREVSGFFAAMSYSAPIPPPSFFEAYERTLPGAADRILGMAEAEQRHRHRMDETVVKAEISGTKAVRLIGLTLALVVLVGGIGLIAIGRTVEGLVTLLPALTGLLGLFYYSERTSKRKGPSPDGASPGPVS